MSVGHLRPLERVETFNLLVGASDEGVHGVKIQPSTTHSTTFRAPKPKMTASMLILPH